MLAFLLALLRLFTGTRAIVPDEEKLNHAVPTTKAEPIAVTKPGDGMAPWYMKDALRSLLDLIALHESGKAGYNSDFRNDDRWLLSTYSLDEVINLAKSQVRQGEASSAIGRYQFLSKTLESLKSSLKLSGKEKFTPPFQDDLAVALMIRRGLGDWLQGKLSRVSFANNLAMEWASLPVVTDIYRGKRLVKAGQSYYAGDGLNKSFHKPEAILAALNDVWVSLSDEWKERNP